MSLIYLFIMGVVPYPTVAFTDYDVFFHTIALIKVIARSEQSPIRSVIIRVIINRKTARWSVIFQARVWLQTQLDDTKSYWQSIITITNSFKKIQKISPIENLSKIKKIFHFWNSQVLLGKWLLQWLLKSIMWLVDLAEWT